MGKSKRRVNKKKRKAHVRPRGKTFENRTLSLADALSLSGQHLESGNLAEAESICRQILQATPDEPNTLHLLSVIVYQRGQIDPAAELVRKAIAGNPDQFQMYVHFGNCLEAQGRVDEAIGAFQKAIALRADCADAYRNIGRAQQRQGRIHEAISAYQKAIQLDPNSPTDYCNLGIVLRQGGRLDDAGRAYRRAIELKPGYIEAYNNLGCIFKSQYRFSDALEVFREAISLKPDFVEGHCNLGIVLSMLGNVEGAIAAQQKALKLNPNSSITMLHLIQLKLRACQWNGLDKLIRRITEMVQKDSRAIDPFFLQLLPMSLSQLQICTQQFAKDSFRLATLLGEKTNFEFGRAQKSKITMGYISPDFRDHAAATVMIELFEHHDHERFEVFGYALGPEEDTSMRRRFIKAFDKFTYVEPMPTEEIAQSIYDDGVDILVDLGGYTRFTRTGILALKPAAIQVNYLGSGATMGVDFMDYMIVDKFIVQPEQAKYFDEKLVYLPDCFLVNDSKRSIAQETPSRADCGLSEDGFVFCCFNNNFKITSEIFDVWMRLLGALPSALLWLLERNKLVAQNLKREAKKRGIDPDRVVFAPIVDRAKYMARYRVADLFLDTLVVSAGATASDALLAGCPVLACAGTTLHSRVAGSMLRAIGLGELISDSLEQYEQLALELARDPKRLRALRAKLKENLTTTPLFNCERTTRQIESAYETMWERYLNKLDPESFSV